MQHGPLEDSIPYCTAPDLTLLPASLRDLGYSTHAFGRWSLGFCDTKCTPLNRGFDTFYGHYTETPNGTPPDWKDGDVDSADLTSGARFYTELLADRVISTIQAATEPYFVYLSFSDLHNHLQIPSRYLDLYPDCDKSVNALNCLYDNSHSDQRRKYLGMISAVDEAVGRIRTELSHNTILVFLTDSGGSHEGYAENYPLRGAAGTLYEGGTRVHGIVSSPTLYTTADNIIHTGLFHATDWAPTLLSLAGGSPGTEYDGYDQSRMVLFGEASRRQHLVYNIDQEQYTLLGQSAIRNTRWKLIVGFDGLTNGRGPLRTPLYTINGGSLVLPTSNWRLQALTQVERGVVIDLVNAKNNQPMKQLFDLQDDPYEYYDLYTRYTDGELPAAATSEIQQLEALLTSERTKYVAPPPEYSVPQARQVAPGWCNM